ncbi:MAG: hypothetical protein J3R72DRAFT_497996 [Linnemannia gamsii]|nr:MAG: hypothetical protein J3R72DRAFT_497996 [Linnemannia gamsii]
MTTIGPVVVFEPETDDIPQSKLDQPSSPSPLPTPEDTSTTPSESGPLLALEKALEKANTGDAGAQVELGDLNYNAEAYSEAMKCFYYFGDGDPKDDSKGFEWILKSAEMGAQRLIVACYKSGECHDRDFDKALEWFIKAAKQGGAVEQRYVGYIYLVGEMASKDAVKAMEWYLKAREQGSEAAQNDIGDHYKRGHGVPQDYTKAVEWFRKAAEQGSRPGSVTWVLEVEPRIKSATVVLERAKEYLANEEHAEEHFAYEEYVEDRLTDEGYSEDRLMDEEHKARDIESYFTIAFNIVAAIYSLYSLWV